MKLRTAAPAAALLAIVLSFLALLGPTAASARPSSADGDAWWWAFRVPQPSPSVLTWGDVRAIASDGEGRLLVVDGAGKRVLRLNAESVVDRVWRPHPDRNVSSNYFGIRGLVRSTAVVRDPRALLPQADGSLWIMDADGILKVDDAGQFSARMPLIDEEGAEFGLRHAVALPDGRIVGVPYRVNQRFLAVFAADGHLQERWLGPDGGDLRSLSGLAATSDGRVLATLASGVVHVFDPDGSILHTWGEQGAGPGQLDRPGPLAVTEDETVLVVDVGNRRIQRFTVEGQYLGSLAGPAGSDERFGNPAVVHVASDGSIVVLDTEPIRLHHLEPSGDPRHTVQLSPAPAYSPYVSRWTRDGAGDLFGHDAFAGRVIHLDAQGHMQNEFWTRPEDPGLKSNGEGIALSPQGDVTVPVDGELRAFDRDGGLVRVFTRTLDTDPAPPIAVDVTADDAGTLYVAETVNRVARVRAIDDAGASIWSIGPDELAATLFGQPMGLALDGSDALLVTSAKRVDRYATMDGHYEDVLLHDWNPNCIPDRQFAQLLAAQSVGQGRLLLTDHSGDRVGILGAAGRWLTQLGGRGNLNRPTFALFGNESERIYTNSRDEILVAFETAPRETWRVERFNNPWLTGWPADIQDIPAASLAEDAASPRRSARLSKWVSFGQGRYEFAIAAQGGVRVWVEGELVLDRWLANEVDETAAYDSPWPARREVVAEFRSPDVAGALTMALRPVVLVTVEPTAPPTPTPTATSRFVATPLPSPTPGPYAQHGAQVLYLPLVLDESPDEAPVPARAWQAIPGIDILHYDIDLSAPVIDGVADVHGIVTITLRATANLDHIALHIDPASVRVREAKIEGSPVGWSIVPGDITQYGLDGSRLTLPLDRPLIAGQEVTVRVVYDVAASSFAHDRGFIYEEVGDLGGLLSTRSAPYFTRAWLPSHDHPSDPADVTYTLRVPEGLLATANGLPTHGDFATGIGTDAAGLTVFRYRRSQALQTYLMRVAMGPLQVHVQPICYNRTGPIELVDCAVAEEQLDLVYFHQSPTPVAEWPFPIMSGPGLGDLELLIFYSRLFGAYPNDRLGALSASHPYSMEYPGMMSIGWRENRHEFIHGWWGNSVRIHDWRDFWIKEGLTTYLTAYWDERYEGSLPMTDIEPCWRGEGEILPAQEYDFLDDFFSGRRRAPYEKGAAAWHDLRWRLARAAGTHIWDDRAIALFESTLAALYQDHAHDFLTTPGLHRWLRENLAERFEAAGFDGDAVDVDSLVRDWSDRWGLHEKP